MGGGGGGEMAGIREGEIGEIQYNSTPPRSTTDTQNRNAILPPHSHATRNAMEVNQLSHASTGPKVRHPQPEHSDSNPQIISCYEQCPPRRTHPLSGCRFQNQSSASRLTQHWHMSHPPNVIPDTLRVESHIRTRNTAEAKNMCPFEN